MIMSFHHLGSSRAGERSVSGNFELHSRMPGQILTTSVQIHGSNHERASKCSREGNG